MPTKAPKPLGNTPKTPVKAVGKKNVIPVAKNTKQVAYRKATASPATTKKKATAPEPAKPTLTLDALLSDMNNHIKNRAGHPGTEDLPKHMVQAVMNTVNSGKVKHDLEDDEIEDYVKKALGVED